jgi:NAD(P)H-hydrate epimerase
MGAAVVAAKACLKTGVGLLTCHVPSSGYPIMQTTLPEAMTSIDNSDYHFSAHPDLNNFSAIGLGPGLGTNNETQEAFEELMKAANVPLVIDADGLNILAQHKKWLNLIPENTILTPHPKEFDRIAGESKSGYERNQKQIELAQKYNIFIILKGAHTAIACPDGSCYYNSTGNPGMATGGTGDALTGIILSLIAQGYSQKEAAISAVYIHGYAGDLAAEQESQEAMIASDLINNLGGVFKLLK